MDETEELAGQIPLPERETAESGQSAGRGADGGFLWDFWYPAARSGEVRGRNLAKAMLLEVPLVLGRTDEGKAFAMRDACPHRGIPLSYGRFDGKSVECSYHGWKFDGCSGQCVEIPSLTSQDKLKVERIFAGHYPCVENAGYLWVFMNQGGRRLSEAVGGGSSSGENIKRPPSRDERGKQQAAATSADDAPSLVSNEREHSPQLATFSETYQSTHLACDLPSHVDQGIIGLMDPAHGPFVHQSWFWRSKTSMHEKAKQFEPIPYGFRMSTHSPSTNSAPYQLLKKMTGAPVTTTIDFVLPNMRTEEIRSGRLWFSSLTTVSPVRRDWSRIDFVAAWNVPLPVTIFRMFARTFLKQDQETMIRQAEGLKYNPRLMLVDDADRPAKWYFALKANLIESRRTGAEMVHPMDGPTMLRWRS